MCIFNYTTTLKMCGREMLLKEDSSLLALNGGGRFLSPFLTLIFPTLLPCLVRDSLCTALQTKILWINWSLNAIDTIETWVSGNLTALTERAALSVEDIDIYLFGTMITGILLIGLGFALGYRRIQKTGTAVQSPTRLPV